MQDIFKNVTELFCKKIVDFLESKSNFLEIALKQRYPNNDCHNTIK